MTSKKYIIYGLADPEKPDVIMYVGATSTPLTTRLSAHLRDAKRSGVKQTARIAWIVKLLNAGKTPLILPLEECEETDFRKTEGKWIGNFRSLKNTKVNGTNYCVPGFQCGDKNYYLHDRLLNWRGDLTQKEAASILGVSVATYRNWEQGRNIPGAIALREIDRFLMKQAKDWQ